jgi:hypothetical protein
VDKDHLVLRVLLDQQDLRDQQVNKDQPVNRAFKDHLELPE